MLTTYISHVDYTAKDGRLANDTFIVTTSNTEEAILKSCGRVRKIGGQHIQVRLEKATQAQLKRIVQAKPAGQA